MQLRISEGCAGWRISDITGRVFRSGQSCAPGESINLSGISDGTYSISLRPDGGNETVYRLVKISGQ
ncbi:MAG: hypothetical protein QM743_03020 [Chitinophagaceae bacterium]